MYFTNHTQARLTSAGLCEIHTHTHMYIFFKIKYMVRSKKKEILYTGSGTDKAPFYYKIFYYKITSMELCYITISHTSAPHDILGEMFKLLSISCDTFMYPPHHTQAGVTSVDPACVHVIPHH